MKNKNFLYKNNLRKLKGRGIKVTGKKRSETISLTNMGRIVTKISE